MSKLMDHFDAFLKEGSEKYAVLRADGNAVRNFADAKRENSADSYDIETIKKVADATLEASLDQSEQVYKMFAEKRKAE